jgi:hypothetical protein
LSDLFKICHTDFKEGGCILDLTHLCLQLNNFQVCFIQQIIWVFAVKPKAYEVYWQVCEQSAVYTNFLDVNELVCYSVTSDLKFQAKKNTSQTTGQEVIPSWTFASVHETISKYKSTCNRYNENLGSKQTSQIIKNWQEIKQNRISGKICK